MEKAAASRRNAGRTGYSPHIPLLSVVAYVLATSSPSAAFVLPATTGANASAFARAKDILSKRLKRHHQPSCPNPNLHSAGQCPAPDASSTAASAEITRLEASPLAAAAASVAATSPLTRGVGAHYLVRIVFLRGLAFVYGVAFLVALHQNKALIGDAGITPARRCLDDAEERGRRKRDRRTKWLEERKNYRNPADGQGLLGVVQNTTVGRAIGDRINSSETYNRLREVLWDRTDRMGRPLLTLLWLAKDRSELNPWLDGVAISGLALSTIMFVLGAANVPLLFGLWLCQRSLMAVGGPWYGYGWEPQLAELGFHAMFLVPALSLDPIPASTPVPLVAIWAMRWFLFRIMLGAGLIKIKSGDPKWKFPELSAMHTFYETQPVPNPLTKFFHAMPKWWHKFEVLTNHFVELIAPWLIILPGIGRQWRIAGGLIQIIFQAILISSGNLSFLNWLTALPAVFCLDDAFLSKLFVPLRTTSASVAAYTHLTTATAGAGGSMARRVVNFAFAALIIRLSIPVVKNLLAKRQLMNASFDPLRLVNTYGAFGVVNEDRDELIVESADNISGPWREYQFKVKPGDVARRPRWISPYHYRLDWQMWIASSAGSIERSPWLFRLLLKLLQQDEGVLGLLDRDPWAVSKKKGAPSADDAGEKEAGGEDSAGGDRATEGGKPKYIRIEKYRYKFNYDRDGDETDTKSGKRPYWKRDKIGRYFPRHGIMTEEMLADYIW